MTKPSPDFSQSSPHSIAMHLPRLTTCSYAISLNEPSISTVIRPDRRYTALVQQVRILCYFYFIIITMFSTIMLVHVLYTVSQRKAVPLVCSFDKCWQILLLLYSPALVKVMKKSRGCRPIVVLVF